MISHFVILIDCILETAKEWQTLISGVFASLVAWKTITQIKQQIVESKSSTERTLRQMDKQFDESKQIESSRIRAKHFSSLAISSHALSSYVEYLRNCKDVLHIFYIAASDKKRVKNHEFYLPEFNEDILIKIANIIEYGSNENEIKFLHSFLTHMQVHRARMQSLREETEENQLKRSENYKRTSGGIGRIGSLAPHNIITYAINTIVLHGYCCELFDYIREDISPEKENIAPNLKKLALFLDLETKLYNAVIKHLKECQDTNIYVK